MYKQDFRGEIMENINNAIKELHDHMDARRQREMYEVNLFAVTENVRDRFTDDQIQTWKTIESVISGEIAKVNPGIDPDKIRERLVVKQG
jgi:hypothetical protein